MKQDTSATKVITPIARIRTDFPEKFGIPRQSGLVPELTGRIVFEPAWRKAAAIKGLEEYSHLWLIWEFSEHRDAPVKASVTPPRLGGREKRGVFATRSPFRPNGLGLSCVTLNGIDYDAPEGPVLLVGGADLLDGTPIFDIKPYIPYADARPHARGSFGEAHKDDHIAVSFPKEMMNRLPKELRETVLKVLAQDPRAAYQKKPGTVVGMAFGEWDIRFVGDDACLTVVDVQKRDETLVHVK
ncbi:MAG: tRNA (N6-threonylcarbamoyladenosine(37)-N6)-methyltransferase TrmO [Lachnospiraceae bacterium]|nr:tRNA (N6-threonylcarbamoyladenosine(37)-N6)-methyltransferase TrmO [Lachnospiraceae bacterium]